MTRRRRLRRENAKGDRPVTGQTSGDELGRGVRAARRGGYVATNVPSLFAEMLDALPRGTHRDLRRR